MSKRKRSPSQRDPVQIASPQLLGGRLAGPLAPTLVGPSLSEYEDRRIWSPRVVSRATSYPPSRRFSGAPARLRAPLHSPQATIAFEAPKRVLVCVRRKIRREVIHARGVAGRRVRKGRKGPYSSIHCR